jgi:arginine/lysine/ornithine decarboxylase
LVPGEEITKELIDYVHFVRRQGVTVTGLTTATVLTGENKDEIEVVD